MLQFHGIRFHNGIPEKFKITYNLIDSLRKCIELLDDHQLNQSETLKAVNQEINKIYQNRNALVDAKQLRYINAKWSRTKDILEFFTQDEDTFLIKITIGKILLHSSSIAEKWKNIEKILVQNTVTLFPEEIDVYFSDPGSEISLILQMIILFFLDQTDELPPANLQIKFLPKQFPKTLWQNIDGYEVSSAPAIWNPKNLHCRHNYLMSRLIMVLTVNLQAIEVQKLQKVEKVIVKEVKEIELIDESKSELIPLKEWHKAVGIPENTPELIQFEYIDDEADENQIAMIELTPVETLNSFQRSIQKKFSQDGVRHFLGIMKQINENSANGICYFDVYKHLNLVAKATKTGRFTKKQISLSYSLLNEIQRLKITRTWRNDDDEAWQNTNHFILQLAHTCAVAEETKNPMKLPVIKLLLDPIFYSEANNPQQMGKMYSLIPEKLFKETGRTHALLPGLSAYFSGTWLIEFKQNRGVLRKTAQEIIEGCAFNVSKTGRYRIIHKLKSELAYMEKQHYIEKVVLMKSKERNLWDDVYEIHATESCIRTIESIFEKSLPNPEKELIRG
ncbi:MAG: hypothetical protein ACI86H_002495 [bacterium]|jgi:hypothetical protein